MDRIGNLLQTERTQKGLEISAVEHATGIRSLYLLALEQGNYEVLPGDAYVKGFLRNYGNFLGLDGAELVRQYNETRSPSVVAQPHAAHSEPMANPVRKPAYRIQQKTALTALLVLAVLTGGLLMWPKNSPDFATGGNLPTRAATSPAGAQTPAAAPAAKGRAVVLTARYSDRCWTSVIADGKTVYEGIPRINEVLTWEADRQIVVNFGNAAAVELTYNGQSQGKVGERGDVVVKTFSASADTMRTQGGKP